MPTVVTRLQHVLIVGGTLCEWARHPAADWDERIDALGEAARRSGASWLTLRPYEQGGDASSAVVRRQRHVGDGRSSLIIIVDPTVDGRERFASAMGELDPAQRVDESTVAAALYAPAESEPDLVVVLGRDSRLPASLVWELGYAELVFLDTPWHEFGAHHLELAIEEFAGRSRRFGGLP